MNFKKYLNARDFIGFLRGLFRNRKIVFRLVENDFRKQYVGSFLGITWAFVQPLFFVLAISFVFSVGLRKTGLIAGYPFLLYLISGIFMWYLFATGLSMGTTAISENSYLVKKVVFRVSMLPMVKILSALVVHLVFLDLMIVLYLVYGFFADIYYLQLIYYFFAASVILLGISWITSSVVLFFPDLKQIIIIITRIGFWFTPIFWSIEKVPAKFQPIIKANPAYYLVMGYRDCLIYKVWFWERPYLTAYFWGLTLVILIVGTILFRKLKPHFADVL